LRDSSMSGTSARLRVSYHEDIWCSKVVKKLRTLGKGRAI
jgi:hypothetical protein